MITQKHVYLQILYLITKLYILEGSFGDNKKLYFWMEKESFNYLHKFELFILNLWSSTILA